MRFKILLLTVPLLLLPGLAFAANVTCLGNQLVANTTYEINVNNNITTIQLSKTDYCQYGCYNSTLCASSPELSSFMSIWLIYGIGIALLALGTVLGIPFGKMVGKERIKAGFDTTIIVKYLFFFVGLFLVYTCLGMARRSATLLGMDDSLATGIDTTAMVMLITIVLFLFVMVIEFVFDILKNMMATGYKKEWGGWDEK